MKSWESKLPAVDVWDETNVVALPQITVQALRSDVRRHANTHHSKEEVAAYAELMRSLLKEEPNNSTVVQLLASIPLDEEAEQISAAKK